MKKDSKNITKLYGVDSVSAIDVEFGRFLQQLDPEIEEPVLLAGVLTSRAYRNGDVCIFLHDYAGQNLFDDSEEKLLRKAPLSTQWRSLLDKSPVVGAPGDFKPLILDEDNRLYLHRLWQHEQNLAGHILKRARQQTAQIDTALLKDGLKRLFEADKQSQQLDWQQIAAAASLYNKLTIISGGPGTGKTTTVIRLLALLFEQAEESDESLSIALAAPTGKAAARMEESILNARASLAVSDKIKAVIPTEAVTVHQLLGARRHTSAYRYNSENPLPFDVIIVDEASMIDQALMNNLMEALLDKTRLVLLGDKDQLASVEAGLVMGNICGHQIENSISEELAQRLSRLSINVPRQFIEPKPAPLTDNIILLTKSYRFKEKSGIGTLARAVNAGEADRAVETLTNSTFSDVALQKIDNYAQFQRLITERMTDHFRSVMKSTDPETVLGSYNRFRLLAAHRSGPWGVDAINHQIENALRRKGLIPRFEEWYAGKPVIINTNDYSMGLSNGDVGMCQTNGDGHIKVFFRQKEGIINIWPSRLPDFSLGYALTVHKSQGSEFENVMLILPDRPSKILSRELLYTAITRARDTVTIAGSSSVLTEAVERSVARNSGLEKRLWEHENGGT